MTHARTTIGFGLSAGAGLVLALSRAGGAQPVASWLEPPALQMPQARCGEPAEHAAHRARVAERSAQERAEAYALAPEAGAIALARWAEARACAQLAGETEHAVRIDGAARSFYARLARDYAEHVERYRLARRAERLPDARSALAFLEAVVTSTGANRVLARGGTAFIEQLRADRARAEEVAP